MAQISRSWFERHPLRVAFDLLGMVLIVERSGSMVSGRIVEAEAYAGVNDLASHSSIYKSVRPRLYGETGLVYMYRSYGIHRMLNVVAHEPEAGGAVLIRAIEPLAGIEEMRRRRKIDATSSLANGPGKLCEAMGLQLTDNGHDLLGDGTIRLIAGLPPDCVASSARIGITRDVARPWRLFDADSPFVSSHRRGDPVESKTLVFGCDV